MSNDKNFARVFKLWAKVSMMVLDGKRDAAKVADLLQSIIDGPSASERGTTYLRLLESITLAPTSGRSTIAEADTVFTGRIDHDFKGLGTNVAGTDMPGAAVNVYEMTKNGTYRSLFGSLSTDLRSLCLTQGQIVEFARTHRHLLRQDGYATFFLFEVNGELFVAHVIVSGGQLKVYVDRFDSDRVWPAGIQHRLVVSQQDA